LFIGNQSPKNLAHLEQPAPVLVRAGEKYDVARRAAEVSGGIRFGYRSNETGFGWTNAVFTALLDELDLSKRELLGVNPATANGSLREVRLVRAR